MTKQKTQLISDAPSDAFGDEDGRPWGRDKLHTFPETLDAVLRGDFSRYPVTAQVGLTSECNHKCLWCSDVLYRRAYKGRMKWNVLTSALEELRSGGTKSVLWTGSGEPTLHPRFPDFVAQAERLGFRQGLITNGSRLDSVDPKAFSWIRVSLDAGDAASHKRLHGAGGFERILSGLEGLRARSSRAVLGVSYLLNSENVESLQGLVKRLDSFGVDYIQVKVRMIERSSSGYAPQEDFLCDMPELDFEPVTTKVLVMADVGDGNKGAPCWGNSFATVLGPTGDMFLCCRLLSEGRFDARIGTLDGSPGAFDRLWTGEKRMELVHKFLSVDGTNGCPPCWMTRMNVEVEKTRGSRIDRAGMLFI